MDARAWFYEKRGWLPHRARRWVQAKPGPQPSVRILFGDGPKVLLAGEAEWLAAELLLAARDARRGTLENAPKCPSCDDYAAAGASRCLEPGCKREAER